MTFRSNRQCLLNLKLPQMMVQMFIHQNRPLIWCEPSEEAVRMRGAFCWPVRGEPVDQLAQALPFGFQVALILDHQLVHGRRIPAERFVVPQHFGFNDASDNPPHERAGRKQVAKRHFDPSGAMRHCLRRVHLAPHPRAIRPQVGQTLFHFRHLRLIEEIFHIRDYIPIWTCMSTFPNPNVL
jgi:hypothetical protein